VHVLCVGGLAQNSTQRSDGSNYGTDDDAESVELYGPMRVIVPGTDDEGFLDGTTEWTSGTSVSAPFVAGIAALMESATEYQITPGELHDLLLRTANVGGLGDEVTGSRRRVNARAAAAELLGIATVAPQVQITSHADGEEILADDFLALFGEATDFLGRDLPIAWRSAQQGDLGTTAPGENIGPELRLGTHELIASATDFLGQITEARIALTVVDNPPVLTIGAPFDGDVYFTGQDVPLLGTAQDQDTWTNLGDGAVAWAVVRRSTGAVVASASGSSGTFPATAPGTFDIVFYTLDGEVETSVAITVEHPPPGTPVVTIETPEHGTTNGGGPFEVRGSATVDGAPLSGTRLRWIAIAGDTEVELCRGSGFDVVTGDDLGLAGGPPVDCSEAVADLFYVANTDTIGDTAWTLRLEARGPAGQIGHDAVAVAYHEMPG
jgi:serine protease